MQKRISESLPWFDGGHCPLYLAPMARYTDTVYRQLCKEQGADVMVTEFVLAESLIHGEGYVWESVDFSPEQRPMGVQLFGCRAGAIAEAAGLVMERMAPDFIDINFGCPASRVTQFNGGSSILQDLRLLESIVGETVRAVAPHPVTCKIRIGWDHDSIVAVEAAQRAEGVGAQAVAVHGRTKTDGYKGEANWQVIEEVAQALQIPVIGNGDVSCAADVMKINEESAVSGIMIGRAALGYPWIFREVKHFMKTGEVLPPPTLAERWDFLFDYARLLLARPARRHKENDIRWIRPRLIAMTKEMPGSKHLRGALGRAHVLEELSGIREEYLAKFGE